MLRLTVWHRTFAAAMTLAAGIFWQPVCLGSAQAAPVSVELDPNQRFQTMHGWEVTLNLADNPHAPAWAEFHEEAIERAVNGIGINRVRLEIRSGAETDSDWNARFISGEISHDQWKPHRYPVRNDNDDPTVINWDGFSFAELDWTVEEHLLPLIAMAEARGEKLWVNICYVSFHDRREAHNDPDEYAEFVLATYLHLNEKYGIVPDSWEVILEPDLKPDMWTGKMIGEAIVATAPRLQAAGFEPAFIVPSVENMRNAVPYMKDIEKVPGAMDHVIEFSYHRYKGVSERNLREIADLAGKHEIGTSMLEFWFGRANSDILYDDLMLANNVAWQGRALMGLFNPPRKDDPNARLRVRRDIRHNRQYFRDVRRGATRLLATSNDASKATPVAFQNTDGSVTVILRVSEATRIRLNALPEGDYRTYYVADNRYRELPEARPVDEAGSMEIYMPGAGLITVTSHGQ
ncbi:MAG: hypothetical protein NXH78_12295 [Hyphomonadaceae bacterium]|nr:hypothetical protein [Hyphomonadaceae bacterium]